MFTEFDRCTFALSVLQGEADAHKILADILEEQGERGLAQWARKRSSGRGRKVDFVLAVIPYRTCLMLAAEFFAHPLGTVKHIDAFQAAKAGAELVGKWASGAVDREQLRKGIRLLGEQRARSGSEDVQRAAFALGNGSAQALLLADQGPDAPVTTRTVSDAARRVARLSRQMINQYLARRPAERSWAGGLFGGSSPRDIPTGNELDWQLTRTGEVLKKLTAST